jgi:hypothetical protein
VKNLSLNKMQEAGGTKHTGVPVKTLKKLLKKAGLKVSGKKATLTRRAKRARLLKGGQVFGRAPQSSVGDMMKKNKIETQDRADATRAEEARRLAGINNNDAVKRAESIQDEATQKRTEEIKRATPSYGYMFAGKGKKSRRA